MKTGNAYKIALSLLFLSFSFLASAQIIRSDDEQVKIQPEDSTYQLRSDDTVVKKEEEKKGLSHATTAGLLSAALPGAGQLYNKKYWKAPIIWGASGFLIYNIISLNKNYQSYKKEAYNRQFVEEEFPNSQDSASAILLNPKYSRLTNEQVAFERDDFQRYRDLNSIILFAVYFLNVIDAVVDAHLMDFKVSEDAIMSFAPWTDYNPVAYRRNSAVGIGLTLTWVK